GFYPRFLTAVLAKQAMGTKPPAGWSRFSALTQAQRDEALRSCRAVSESLYSGLDLTGEIRATHALGLGDTALLESPCGVAAFAICHFGPRSEAGADSCLIKFGAVRDGLAAEHNYLRLLDACEALPGAVGVSKLLAGANLARQDAYRHLLGRGFRIAFQG